jgi:class 3 adenylate cyclase
MPELPTGTVTFLFSDIQGSTQLLQRLGARYADMLADHQRLLRAAWADHDGVEVVTQGDSFFVVFPHATDALAAAAQGQRALAAHQWPAGGQVRVRMGLHTGVGTLANGHYVGLDVHRAARIAAAGHGGQVLLSQATRDQVAKELVAGAGLRDLGKHRLKDLPRREEIYQLVLPGMPAEYPPLKTLDAWPGYRADLVAVVLISTVLLAAVGLAVPALVVSLPRAIGLGAAGLAVLLLVSSAVVRPVRRVLAGQWRDHAPRHQAANRNRAAAQPLHLHLPCADAHRRRGDGRGLVLLPIARAECRRPFLLRQLRVPVAELCRAAA